VTGISEIRSKMRERERDRTRELAMHKERQRSQLEHLNQYLRHEVLNEANKINGYATLVTQRVDDDRSADHLETIRRSSSEIADFIESIREILAAADHDPELEPTDIVPVLEREAELIGAEYRSVAVDVDAPESASVLCGGLVRRIFRNLIENAIEHNDGAVSIGIDVTCGERWVTVRVRDDGSGIPGERRDDLFQPPTGADHGYGLFLMRNLAEVYGGRLDLERTGPEGTEFAVRLLAESARDGPRSPERAKELAAPGREA
jgi:signal transduction histidine kinase